MAVPLLPGVGALEPAQLVPRLVDEFARGYDDVSALALAVAKDGRLRYSYGFGITDPISGAKVQPESTRFRIASLTKPITAAAVFRLVDQGLLSLDAQVFDAGGLLADLGIPLDERASDITVGHLLQHASGLATNDGTDPMFSHRELATPRELIATVMRERRLDRDPGTGYAYSNLGYSVLGRVIEKVTGLPYDQHLRDGLLAECGITDMWPAGDRRADRARGEVFYYGYGDDPYDIPVHRMDAHGGWIGTAVDMVRFIARVDGQPLPADVLSAGVRVGDDDPVGGSRRGRRRDGLGRRPGGQLDAHRPVAGHGLGGHPDGRRLVLGGTGEHEPVRRRRVEGAPSPGSRR